jgi:hypothetical protein
MVLYSQEELRAYDPWYTTWSEASSGLIPKKTMTNLLRSTHLPEVLLAEVRNRHNL